MKQKILNLVVCILYLIFFLTLGVLFIATTSYYVTVLFIGLMLVPIVIVVLLALIIQNRCLYTLIKKNSGNPN